MLQQTQVATVLPYYARFLAALSRTSRRSRARRSTTCSRYWSGLGYYRRAHHLHAAAKEIVANIRRRVSAGCRVARDVAGHRPLDGGRDRRVRVRRAQRDPRRQREARARAPSRHRRLAGRAQGRGAAVARGRAAAARHAGSSVHAGHDGPRRDGVPALASALRHVSRCTRIASRASRHRIDAAAGAATGEGAAASRRCACS